MSRHFLTVTHVKASIAATTYKLYDVNEDEICTGLLTAPHCMHLALVLIVAANDPRLEVIVRLWV